MSAPQTPCVVVSDVFFFGTHKNAVIHQTQKRKTQQSMGIAEFLVSIVVAGKRNHRDRHSLVVAI
jgi:hypothetical protein